MSASLSETIAKDVAAADRPMSDPMSLVRMERTPTHPGQIFQRDFLEGGTWDKQAVAAAAMRWRFSRVNDFVTGQHSLTYAEVLDVAEFTKTSPEFWATLQMRHDLWHAMQERKSR